MGQLVEDTSAMQSPKAGERLSFGTVAQAAVDQVEEAGTIEDAEMLRQELALFQAELDAIQEHVTSIQRESQALGESVRRRGEARAREIVARAEREAEEIVQQATVKAELLELRARMRAEETRARALARLWGRLDIVRADLTMERALSDDEQGISLLTSLRNESLREQQAPEPELAQLLSFSPPSNGHHQDDVVAPTAVAPREAPPSPGKKATDHEQARSLIPLSSSTGSRKYLVTGPMAFPTMLALEQAVNGLPGIVSAAVLPHPDGGAVLSLYASDAASVVEQLLALPDFPLRMEDSRV